MLQHVLTWTALQSSTGLSRLLFVACIYYMQRTAGLSIVMQLKSRMGLEEDGLDEMQRRPCTCTCPTTIGCRT